MTKPPKKKKTGFFIAFEGGEGVGKSTQIHLLKKALTQRGYPVTVTRQPGGTVLGQRIRALLLDPLPQAVVPRAELLLYMADRAQHVEEWVRPCLAKGHLVLTDRYGDSSIVYQGLCRGLGEKRVRALNQFSTGNLEPDLVFVLDLPVEEAQKRMRSRTLDRIEQENKAFHDKVRKGFLKLARENRGRFVVLNAAEDANRLATQVQAEMEKRLKRRGLWKKAR